MDKTHDVRTVLFLFNTKKTEVLLLHRSETKKLWPSKQTGIGGKVEEDEMQNITHTLTELSPSELGAITASLLRETKEEISVAEEEIRNLTCHLITTTERDGLEVIIYWYTGIIDTIPLDLQCTEGTLIWTPVTNILSNPDAIPFIPSAKACLTKILTMRENETIAVGKIVENQIRMTATLELM